jgi:general secretion pathway protein D
VPGLADLPFAGRLFSNNDDTVNKTEVVLLITPRVIRNVERPGVKLEEFSSGTEAEVGGATIALPAQAIPSGAQPRTPPEQPAPSRAPSQPALPSAPPSTPGQFPPQAPAAGPQTPGQ